MANVQVQIIARVLIERIDDAESRVANYAAATWARGNAEGRVDAYRNSLAIVATWARGNAEGRVDAYRNSLAIVAGSMQMTGPDWEARIRSFAKES